MSFVLVGLVMTSCSMRLVDFTVISSKNVNLAGIKKSEGVRVEASKSYFLGIGWNIKDGIDKALEQAGPQYDMLIDGVVRYSSFPFVATIKVEGTAVNSETMVAKMGQEAFNQWLSGHQVTTVNTAKVIVE
ncbi:hypothetical protein [Wenyingzhuangia sp. 2_MG-2023]|uniref:hypothetical protein n=1 Tax=Wenyingzhuangia sp. 2_MG-2023 TaxID=3062639 RepID=UPI0026E3AE03|nr:hypothetical protein [Wenyingzhuangia sp. 2_MG-2023]MDO6801068.1 hypothetical protein [Wenyingzhuangia sp. 1_MG-2023]